MPVGNQSSGGGGGGAGAGAIRAGKAVVEIFTNTAPLVKGLQFAKAQVLALGGALQKIGGVSLKIGGGAFAGLSALLGSGIDRADKIGDLAEVFGLTAEKASDMANAWEIAGGSLDDLETAFTKIAKMNVNGEPPDEFFLKVADSLGEIEDASERVRQAQELGFGKFATKFIDSGFDVRQHMGKSGTINDEQIQNAKKYKQSMAEVGIALQQALLPALSYITPLVKQFAEFVKANAGVLTVVFAVTAGLTAFGLAAFVVGTALAGIGMVLGVIAKGVALLFTPLGLVVALVVGGAAAFVTMTESGKKTADWFRGGFVSVLDTVKTTFGGVLAAIKGGNLALAGQIALAGLNVVWRDGMVTLQQGWNWFKGVFVDGWGDMITGAAKALNNIGSWTEKVFQRIATAIGNVFRRVAGFVLDTAISAAKGLDSLDPTDQLAGTIAALEGLRARVGGDVDADAGVAAIEAVRVGRERELDDENALEKARRKAIRDDALAEAEAEANAARAKLRGLAGFANAGDPMKAALSVLSAVQFGQMKDAAGPGAQVAANMVKGGFGSFALQQQFGVADKADKQNELLGKIMDGNGKLPQKIGAAVAIAMAFA